MVTVMQTKTLFAVMTILTFLSLPTHGENWTQWRGTGLSGVVAGSGYPMTWSEEENVLWKIPLPGWGTSTPAIWDQQIYVTCEDGEKNAILCLDRDKR